MEKENKNSVVVRLSKEQAHENTKDLRVYVVDAGGKVIEKAAFEKAEAHLKTPQKMLEGKSKIYIAPEIKTNARTSTLNERNLLKANAYETVKNFSGNYLNVSRIPSSIFGPINYFNCRITGHVQKNFFIDGKWETLPLCGLRVHICEVESELIWPYIPIYYRPIPDWVINEIGQKFVAIANPPIPDPIGPISGIKTNLPLRSLSSSVSKQTFKSRVNAVKALPEEVKSAMNSGSIDLIRQTMIDYHDIIYPYLCLWPVFWPWIYTYDEETIVTTDCNGHFEMWENTFTEDGPLNIYIWVEAFINGQWITVYKPSLVCNTWWNYSCGSEITINITDQRVVPCNCGNDGPSDAFWFRSVGYYAGALHIEQDQSHNVNIQGVTVNNSGCTDTLGISNYISPFGGSLALEVFAGENIYNSGTGVTHFRWKATKIKDENLNPIPSGFQTTTILNADSKVYREYVVQLDTVHYHAFNLEIAPDGTGDNVAFRIPHQDITQEASIMAAYPTNVKFWRDIFWNGATVDSNSLGNGLFRFDLELGRYSGSNFVVTNVNRSTFQISELNDLDSSQDATDAYLHLASPGVAHNFSMLLRIDNAYCNADIHDAMLNETSALSGPCGFIKYTDTNQHVHISFEATHPRNFATFSFYIVKGNNTVPTGINPSGYVLSSVGGYTLASGLFSNDYTVLSLLNGCIGQAAFSENLYVYALATDGNRRLNEYDWQDTNAFALSNT